MPYDIEADWKWFGVTVTRFAFAIVIIAMVAIYVAVKSSKNEPNTTKKVDIVHSITVAEVNNLPGQAIMVNRTEHTCVGMGCSDNSRIKIIVKDGNGILHTYDLGGNEGELFLNAKVGANLKNPNW